MTEPVNTAQLFELKDLLGDEFEELISNFMNQSQTHLKTILAALDQSNNTLGTAAAQLLRGESANLGANDLTSFCQKLISECKANRIQHSEVLVHTVREELHRVSHFLRLQTA
jgi:HPt (histidine-containing phosphotransfer) domain-containing protein